MQGSIILHQSFSRGNESQIYQEVSEAFDRLGYHFDKKSKYKALSPKSRRVIRQSH